MKPGSTVSSIRSVALRQTVPWLTARPERGAVTIHADATGSANSIVDVASRIFLFVVDCGEARMDSGKARRRADGGRRCRASRAPKGSAQRLFSLPRHAPA